MFDSFFSFGYVRLADPLLRGMRRGITDFAGLSRGQSVLDVCCGTGAQVYEYARRGLEATGIDLDPKMVKQAEWYRAKFPDLKPALIVGDAARMPFSDGSFDAASISLALHEKDSALQDAILQELRRVVKPGGYIIFADFRAPLPKSFTGYGIQIVESSVGGEHHRDFRAYLRAGGLPSILRRQGFCLTREGKAVADAVQLILSMNPAVC